MKKIFITINAFFALFMCQLGLADSGLFFNVSATGSPGNVSLTLCLNGAGPLSCQNYTVNALRLSIRTTTPNHVYPSVGMKINTPGYTIASLGLICTPASNGFCLFSANDKTPTSISISSTNLFSVGGTVTGITGPVVLQNNGGNSTTVSASGAFMFSTLLAQGNPYHVMVAVPPAGQTCTVTNGSGTIGGSNVTNVGVNCAGSPATTITVSSNGIIPYTGSNLIQNLTVTNTGTSTAYNVKAVLPGAWTAVTQNFSNCATIAPNGGTCTLSFTSTAPYIAQGSIPITGDNIPSPPTTALAFSVGGYLVWSVDSSTSVSVIDTANLLSSPEVWGGNGTAIGSTAQSLTLGASNTTAIITALGTGSAYAAEGCNQSTNGGASIGDWYLPAICQMGGANQGAGCSVGAANIDSNLVQLGFGGLFGPYWSSTERLVNPQQTAWTEYFASNGGSLQAYENKTFQVNVRCSRALSL